MLRSAQEAAEEIRKRAEERAGGSVREAQEEATPLREDARSSTSTARRRGGRARRPRSSRPAAEAHVDGAARAGRARCRGAARDHDERAGRDAAKRRPRPRPREIATAKASSRALVDEARTVRERVLADLGRRRSLLQAQVDELRSGRDRLLDAYRVVKRTLSDATDALAQVEARANAELAAPPPRVAVPPVEGELEMLEGLPPAEPSDGDAGAVTEIDLEEVVLVEEPSEAGAGTPPEREGLDSEDSGAAVDALFARLRASHSADPTPGDRSAGAGFATPGPRPPVRRSRPRSPRPKLRPRPRRRPGPRWPEPAAESEPTEPEPEAAAEPEPEPTPRAAVAGRRAARRAGRGPGPARAAT